jgi:hypothetical protein
MRKEIYRFRTKTDSGVEHTIVVYQEIIVAENMQDPGTQISGFKTLETSAGFKVSYINSETFNIVATDEIVRKF